MLKAPYRDDLVGDPDTGVIAGGVITALLDHVCGQSVWTKLETFTSIATLDLRIDYMRAAEPGLDVYAEAHCYKMTRGRSPSCGPPPSIATSADDPVATAHGRLHVELQCGAQRPAPTTSPSRKCGDAVA